MKHPILIVAADPDESGYLAREIEAGGVTNPLVLLSSSEAAIDYLEAVRVADLKTDAFTPCLLLVDSAISHEEVQLLTRWIRSHETNHHIKVVELDDSVPPDLDDQDGADFTMPRRPPAHMLREVAMHACS